MHELVFQLQISQEKGERQRTETERAERRKGPAYRDEPGIVC